MNVWSDDLEAEPAEAAVALARELAASAEGLWVTCASGSMAPAAVPGQRVRVRAGGALRPGDVVLFETGDGRGLILHRLVAFVPAAPYFLHEGDADASGPRAAMRARLVGRAELPRSPPSAATRVAAAVYVARAGLRRFRRAAKRYAARVR